MKYIFFATVISLVSMNSFALGQQADKGCSYCTPCKKVVCKDTQVDSDRLSRKADGNSKKNSASKKPTAAGQ